MTDKSIHELAGSFATVKMLASKIITDNPQNIQVVRLAELIFKIADEHVSQLKSADFQQDIKT